MMTAREKKNAQMKAKGYTHYIVASIYPKGGGDDYLLDMYLGAPPSWTEDDVTRHVVKCLRRRTDDPTNHRITKL